MCTHDIFFTLLREITLFLSVSRNITR